MASALKPDALFERELAEVDLVLWSGDQVDELADLGLEARLGGLRESGSQLRTKVSETGVPRGTARAG